MKSHDDNKLQSEHLAQETAREISRYARDRMRRQKQSVGLLSWLRDQNSHEVYPDIEYPRSAAQEARRHWIRAHAAWPFLSRFQSAFAVKMATALPIASLLIQSIPELKGKAPVNTFGWLFFAGITWLAALAIYFLRAPRLLKAVSTSYAGLTGAPRRALLTGYAKAALIELAYPAKWRSMDAMLDERNPKRDVAKGLAAYGYTPIKYGFDLEAQAIIESALYEWAGQRQVRILERGREGELVAREQRLRGYGVSFEPSASWLTISQPSEFDVEKQPEVSRKDLILVWADAHVGMAEKLVGFEVARTQRAVCEGVELLFRTDPDAEAFAAIVAQWSNWSRPWSRACVLLLYALTAVLIGRFIWLQAVVMWGAM
ncbi:MULTISPECIES: hypothetical protein [Lysobacter]|uniref:hypothetical protein n=1 Tax=Lysobacter TaxID=68 RepID=UPI001F486FC6|nr:MULTISPECIES: hypothetical protein [Lysobacter]UJB19224.1 hypothetical protein L1A79_23415 [Lysobacter capsici]UJQ27051.1 hypothetical protein L2D09_16470 [Lysobacter gummosus]